MAMTGPQAAAALRRYAKELDTVAVVPVRRVVGKARKQAVTQFRSRGLGRHLWATKRPGRSSPPLKVYTLPTRYSKSGAGFETGLRVLGMAALIERGGRTKPHYIRGNGKMLVFRTKSGAVVRAKVVRHTGGPVKREPAAEPALNRHVGQIRSEVIAALTELGRTMGLR